MKDGLTRAISVWREDTAKKAGGTGGFEGGGDDGADGEGCSGLDSHVGRRRVSADSGEWLSHGPATESSCKSPRSGESTDPSPSLQK